MKKSLKRLWTSLIGAILSLVPLASTAQQPPFITDGLIAYYPFNGNANDLSGGQSNGSSENLVFSMDRRGAPNSSLLLTADTNHAPAPILVKGLPAGNSPRTFSVWFKTKGGFPDKDACLFSYGSRDPKDNFGEWLVDINDQNPNWGGIELGESVVNGANVGKWKTGTGTFTDGIWKQWVVTYDGGSRLKIYINGEQLMWGDGAFAPPLNTLETAFTIGKAYWGQRPFIGELDDLRIYNRALSSNEVAALYQYESTTPDNNFITDGLVAYYPFNGNANDLSGGQSNGSSENLVYGLDRRGAPNSSLLLTADTNHAPAPILVKGLPVGNSPRTFSVWFKTKGGFPDKDACLFSYGSRDPKDNFGEWLVDINDQNPNWGGIELGESVVNGANVGKWKTGTGTFTDGIWKQWVVTYDGGSRLQIYINGEQLMWGDGTFAPPLNTLETAFTIGKAYWGQRPFIGGLDDLRIYNRELSAGEVAALYKYESVPRTATATATAQVANGLVIGFTVTDGGYGYANTPSVTIKGGGGNGATAQATVLNGVVTAITIVNSGNKYISPPKVTIDPPPSSRATGASQVVNGFVIDAAITDGGFGYTTPPNVLLTGGGGSGATAAAIIQNGVVTDIIITNAGTGYTSAPTVRIASPPFDPSLSVEVSRVNVTLKVVQGLKYRLESTLDMSTWTPTGTDFVAEDEILVQEFPISTTGRYFRISQVP